MKRIEDEDARPDFDKAWDEQPNVNVFSDRKLIAEHFFQAGRESVAEELETWRSLQPKPRRIELHLTIKNESDSSNPVTLEQVFNL